MRQRFIQSFPTSDDIQTALDNKELGKPYIALSREEPSIDWNSKELTPPLSAQPLTFKIISADTISFIINKDSYATGPELSIEYKLNDNDWSRITNSLDGTNIHVSPGDIVQFRGDNQKYTSGKFVNKQNTQLKVNGLYKIYGNIASLMSSTNFTSIKEYPDFCFWQFFAGETGLTEVTELAFGDNIGSANWHMYCFQRLFKDCTNLTLLKTLAQTDFYVGVFADWLTNVSPTGTFIKHPDATLPNDSGGIPTGWTIVDAEI